MEPVAPHRHWSSPAEAYLLTGGPRSGDRSCSQATIDCLREPTGPAMPPTSAHAELVLLDHGGRARWTAAETRVPQAARAVARGMPHERLHEQRAPVRSGGRTARRSPRRPRRGGPLAHPGDAGPDPLRCRPSGVHGPPPSSRRRRGSSCSVTRPPLDISCARWMMSCGSVPTLAPWSAEVEQFREGDAPDIAVSDGLLVPLEPGGAPPAPLPPDPPDVPGGRGAALRVAEHRELAGGVDLTRSSPSRPVAMPWERATAIGLHRWASAETGLQVSRVSSNS